MDLYLPPALTHPVRLHDLVSHHFSSLHGRACCVACFLEALSLATGRPVYRRLFDFWTPNLRSRLRPGRRPPASSWPSSSAPTGANWRAGSGAIQRTAPQLRELHGLRPRGLVLRRAHLRPQAGAAVVSTCWPASWSWPAPASPPLDHASTTAGCSGPRASRQRRTARSCRPIGRPSSSIPSPSSAFRT